MAMSFPLAYATLIFLLALDLISTDALTRMNCCVTIITLLCHKDIIYTRR